jgi:hypothetical protein
MGTLQLQTKNHNDIQLERLVDLWNVRMLILWQRSSKEARERFVEWLEEEL